jgi:hypothetical protein
MNQRRATNVWTGEGNCLGMPKRALLIRRSPMWHRVLGAFGAGLIGFVVASSARAETYQVCTGEDASKCPGAFDRWFPCGTSPIEAAQTVCRVYDADGRPVNRRFREPGIRYIKEGGRCGYGGYIVECLDNP